MKNETREKKTYIRLIKKKLNYNCRSCSTHTTTYIGIGDDIVRYQGKCMSTHTVPNQEKGKYSSERQEG